MDDDCMKAFGEYVKSNKHIETVEISSAQISDAGIEILAPYLEGNTTLRCLRLGWNKKITDKSIPLLMKMVETSRIEVMNINETSVTRTDMFIAPLTCNIIKNGTSILNLIGQ